MFSVVRTKNIWFTISSLLFVASLLAVGVWGFKYGIDFTGGSLIELVYNVERPTNAIVIQAVQGVINDAPQVQTVGTDRIMIRTPFIDEKRHQEILQVLKKISGNTSAPTNFVGAVFTEARFETIGPTISAELKNRAQWSIVAVLVAIIIYIAWAFRQVSQPLSSWKYGVVAVVALLHDVLIPSGIFAVLGKVAGYEVDTLFVTAVLTILGFSVHDTIVTFDRVREHLKRTPKANFSDLVDCSVRETLRRSINTSLTVLLVLLPVYIFSDVAIRHFTLTLILGVIFGTYSSIFIACPLLVMWNNFAKRSH